jgi:hypothetical protein
VKEAIGGSWLFMIVITFLAIFTTFVSATTNYSRTYKIKDEIVQDIEYYRGVNKESIDKINNYIKGIGYTSKNSCPDDGDKWMAFSTQGNPGNYYSVTPYSGQANYCIKKIKTVKQCETYGPSNAYYKVVVFFRIDWPVFRTIFNVKVAGETAPVRAVGDCSGSRSISTLKEPLYCGKKC